MQKNEENNRFFSFVVFFSFTDVNIIYIGIHGFLHIKAC